jgi:glycosyltransferase involved in cell wall biosynthesis
MLLSACLLSYNSSNTLESAIKSILKQDFTDYELIISDDCSTDNSWDIINKYAQTNSHIVPVRTSKNSGVAGNANFAVDNAKGKYVAILHHDDEFRSDLFGKWIKLMEENPNVGLCFNDYSCNEKNIISLHEKENRRHYDKVMIGQEFLKKDLLKYWGCPVWGSYVTRKEIWDALNGFKPEFGILPDVDLTFQIASDWDVGYINEPLMDLKRGKPDEYPEEYSVFNWQTMFTLYNIHDKHVNRKNYTGSFEYLLKKFTLKNRISYQIIKWHLYAVYKKRNDMLTNFPGKSKNELFYSKIIRYTISKILSGFI